MKRVLGLLLLIAALAFVALMIREFSSRQIKPTAVAVSSNAGGEIVALRDRSTLLVQKGSVGQDIVEWLASGEPSARKFELGGHQFIGRTDEPTPEAIGRATRLVALLRAYPEVIVTVVGHTDPSADDEADRALSLARAQRLVNLLVSGGIRAVRLDAEGYGSTDPLADNRTAEGRAQNQRVTLILRRGDK